MMLKTMENTMHSSCFPRRSRSGDQIIRLKRAGGGDCQNHLRIRRSKSLPLEGVVLEAPAADRKPSCSTCTLHAHSDPAPVAPSLCRWSSVPPCERILETPRSMTPQRARSMRNLRILPPRYPTRKSGRAEELRAALPPTCPMRKPGDSPFTSDDMPPFQPKRQMDNDACDNHGDSTSKSHSNSTGYNLTLKGNYSWWNNQSHGTTLGSSTSSLTNSFSCSSSIVSNRDDHDYEDGEDGSQISASNSLVGMNLCTKYDNSISSNFNDSSALDLSSLQRVLGEVLEQLGDMELK